MENKDLKMAFRIADLVAQRGGTAYYIGGYVRDKLLQRENKDIDIEVHGLYPAQLEEVLGQLGKRMAIGESFGIYNLKGYSLDIAMPRKEEQRGSGHKDFDVFVDPFIGTRKAALRRDFTMNALMENILTGEVVDHFGGSADLRAGIIRHVNDSSFIEDPLRVLRAAQFAARFEFSIAEETLALCGRMDLSALPRERILGELEKALLKAKRPSIFFESLRRMGQLSFWFPELERTIGVEQDPIYHPEGDVWTHTMMVLDAAVQYRDQVSDPLGFMLAALTHDFGKVLCSEKVNGRIRAYQHEILGLPLVRSFLRRLTRERARTRYVLNLSELHMKPLMMANDRSSLKATNKMFDQAADPEALICLSLADGLGKRPSGEDASGEAFLLERLAVFREYMNRPRVTGRDLIDAGISPSEHFSEYMAFAHKLHLAGVSKENALPQVLALVRKTEGGRG